MSGAAGLRVVVVDAGGANLGSVCYALERLGVQPQVVADATGLQNADRVILPGVGAAPEAMRRLHAQGLVEPLRALAVPLLGICLGMQLLLDESEEFGITRGLGIIPGRVLAIPQQTTANLQQKIPHIGWNALVQAEVPWRDTLLADTVPGDATYFVHSFMAAPDDPAHRLADCFYGGHRIPAVIARGRTTGCQFHPEKSGEVGLTILRRFCAS